MLYVMANSKDKGIAHLSTLIAEVDRKATEAQKILITVRRISVFINWSGHCWLRANVRAGAS